MRNKLVLLILAIACVSCTKLERPQGNALWCVASTEGTDGTRGLEVVTDSLNTENNVFVLDGWLEVAGASKVDPALVANPHYLASKDLKLKGEYWTGDKECAWADGLKTNFWAVYPKTAEGRGNLEWPALPSVITTAQQKTPYFSYDMTSFSGARKDAAMATQDILVSYASAIWNESEQTGGILTLKFRHALSGLRFKRGHIDSGYNITEIKISGIHLVGTCSLTGSTPGGKDTLAIAWTGTDTPGTSTSLTQTINAGTVAEGELILSKELLYAIPQEMTTTATISAVIEDTVNSTSETREVSLSGYSWKPGKLYDYTLSYYYDKDEFVVNVKEYTTSTGSWTN